MKKKVHLVLGSGGARGLAHIGVIEMLERDGYEICEVAGCSMGAVVGGIYCAGYLENYTQWLRTLTRTSVFSLMDFTLTTKGFIKGEKVLGKMMELTGEQQIENLKIPFTAVATDMMTMEEVHFTKGNLYEALRASIAIPGIFTPVVEKGTVLVDGGVLNPVPMNLIHKQKDAIVVAVNLNGKSKPEDSPQNEEEAAEKSWLTKFLTSDKSSPPTLSLFDLLQTSYRFTQDRLIALMIEHYKPDIVVEIPRNACWTFDFHRADELIEMGKEAYQEAVSVTKF